MTATRFDFQQFFQRPNAVAVQIPGGEMFGLLKRSFDLPAQWAALVTRETGDQIVVSPGGGVERDSVRDVLCVRTSPFDLTLSEDGVMSRDGFHCTAKVHLRLRLLADRSEMISFAKSVVGSGRAITAATIERYLQTSVREGLFKAGSNYDACDLVSGAIAGKLAESLTKALQSACFAAGLVADGSPAIRFESSTFKEVQRAEEDAVRRQREQAAERRLQEAIEQSQQAHMEHLTSLLTQLHAKAADSPDVELADLIRTFGEHQRGELYEALFAAGSGRMTVRWLLVVAGDELLFFDPGDFDRPRRRLTVGGAAGPVRSVQMATGPDGEPLIYLGALRGVYEMRLDQVEPQRTYMVMESVPARGGFNSVVRAGDRILASHSEQGIHEWIADSDFDGKQLLADQTDGAKAVRGISFLNGDVYCSIDERVVAWRADDPSCTPTRILTGSRARITDVCPTGKGVFAGNRDGAVLHWPVGRTDRPDLLHAGRGDGVESVQQMAIGGIERIIFTDNTNYVYARVLGDTFTCRYEGAGQNLRRVEAGGGLLASMNELRDRIVLWQDARPERPLATLMIGALTGQTAQDACIVAV